MFRLYDKSTADDEIKFKEIHITDDFIYLVVYELGKYKMIRKTI